MNELLEFLTAHASCRSFTEQPITAEQEQAIITTAQRSPPSSNLQAYSIIGIRDQAAKDTLARLSGGQAHVAQASLFLVFCADLYRLHQLSDRRGYPFHGEDTELFIIATVDAALAASRALMAAQALGFGGVMVGGIRNDPRAVGRLLGLPRLVYPVMGMSLGQPASPPKIKPRLSPEAVYFRERYDDSVLDENVRAYDKELDRIGYLRRNPVEPDKYPAFDGLYSWSEHTARRLASDKPTTRRQHMRPYLQEQGFLKD